jgi:surface antigen
MKKLLLAILACALMLPLAACETNPDGTFNKANIGTVLGGIGGAVAGAQFGKGNGQLIGTAIGTMGGAFLGRELGKSLDNADRAAIQNAHATAQTAPIGQPVNWSNPQNGNYGSVTPVREGRSNAGAYCREFQQEIIVGGKTERGFGTACQQPDGSWRMAQ